MPLPDDVAHLFDLAGIFPLNYREFAPVGALLDEHLATEAFPPLNLRQWRRRMAKLLLKR